MGREERGCVRRGDLETSLFLYNVTLDSQADFNFLSDTRKALPHPPVQAPLPHPPLLINRILAR